MCCRSLWREGGEEGGGGGREERREGEEERREGEEGRREGEERANQEPRGGSPIKADVRTRRAVPCTHCNHIPQTHLSTGNHFSLRV